MRSSTGEPQHPALRDNDIEIDLENANDWMNYISNILPSAEQLVPDQEVNDWIGNVCVTLGGDATIDEFRMQQCVFPADRAVDARRDGLLSEAEFQEFSSATNEEKSQARASVRGDWATLLNITATHPPDWQPVMVHYLTSLAEVYHWVTKKCTHYNGIMEAIAVWDDSAIPHQCVISSITVAARRKDKLRPKEPLPRSI